MSVAEVRSVSDASFADDVLAAPLPVIVDFWAPWCPPCRITRPVFAELAAEFAGELLFTELNTDENKQITAAYNVASIPTFILFSGGVVQKVWVGARSKSALREEFSAALCFLPRLPSPPDGGLECDCAVSASSQPA